MRVPRLLRVGLQVCLVAIGMSAAPPAEAEEDCAKTLVALEFADETMSEADRKEILRQLRAGLRERCIEVELRNPATLAAVATLTLSGASEGRTVLLLSVSDRLTQKRVERSLDLSSFSAEARALALSVAAEELFLASWSELALERASPPVEAPPPVKRWVQEKMPERGPLLTFAAAFRSESHRLEEVRLGAELALRLGRGGAFAQLGIAGMEAFGKRTPTGDLAATGLSLALGGGYERAWSKVHLEGSALVRFGGEFLRFESRNANYVSLERWGPAVALEFGVGGGVRLFEGLKSVVYLGGGPVLAGYVGTSPEGEKLGTSGGFGVLALRLEATP